MTLGQRDLDGTADMLALGCLLKVYFENQRMHFLCFAVSSNFGQNSKKPCAYQWLYGRKRHAALDFAARQHQFGNPGPDEYRSPVRDVLLGLLWVRPNDKFLPDLSEYRNSRSLAFELVIGNMMFCFAVDCDMTPGETVKRRMGQSETEKVHYGTHHLRWLWPLRLKGFGAGMMPRNENNRQGLSIDRIVWQLYDIKLRLLLNCKLVSEHTADIEIDIPIKYVGMPSPSNSSNTSSNKGNPSSHTAFDEGR